MAWNPAPEVAAARDFGKKFNADRVIVLYTTKTGQVGYASYGETKELCAATKKLADATYDPLMNELEVANG